MTNKLEDRAIYLIAADRYRKDSLNALHQAFELTSWKNDNGCRELIIDMATKIQSIKTLIIAAEALNKEMINNNVDVT